MRRSTLFALATVWFMAGYLLVMHVAMGGLDTESLRGVIDPVMYLVFPVVCTVAFPIYEYMRRARLSSDSHA